MDTSAQKKPSFIGFKLVLVLSLIGSGMCFLSFILTGLMYPTLISFLENGGVQFDELGPLVDALKECPRYFFFGNGILYGISLAGAILMWNYKWEGFHFYTSAQLLIIVFDMLVLGKSSVNIGDVMLTLFFIAYYFLSLKAIHKFLDESDQNSDDAFTNTDGPALDNTDQPDVKYLKENNEENGPVE